MKYIVFYKNNSLGYLQVGFALSGGSTSGDSYKFFETKEALQDWLSDEQENIKGVRIYVVEQELKLKKERVQLIEV